MSTAQPGRELDVIIIGAGIIGAAMAALALARKLVEPGRIAIVAERLPSMDAPQPASAADWDVRVFALSRASQRLLAGSGIWDLLPALRIFAYERMCVWDADGGPNGAGSLCFDCAEIGEPNLGHIVDGGTLQRESLAAARAAGVALIEAGVGAIDIRDDAVRVGLEDGRELRAALLIGADGTESKTRALLGIGTAGHAYHQDALVAHVRTSKPHRNTAWQRFLPSGPLAFLPLPDGRSSIVWSTTRQEATRLRALDAAAFGAALTAASSEVLGTCELTTPLAGFPLKLQYALAYARPRAVLLGDAAHAVHPLAGQGLNLGLLDCASLADVLADANPHALGDFRLLRRYERWRRSENLLAATAFDGLERLFSNANPLAAALRTGALSAVSRLPLLKRQFAERALGVKGDVPAFLKVDPPWPRI